MLREQIRDLFQKAKGDAQAAKHLLLDMDMPRWTIGFHAQQAVEKALKSVLAARQIRFPYTHSINILLDLLIENGITLPPHSDELPGLSRFGVLMRYDTEEINRSDDALIECLVTYVEPVLVWAEPFIPSIGRSE